MTAAELADVRRIMAAVAAMTPAQRKRLGITLGSFGATRAPPKRKKSRKKKSRAKACGSPGRSGALAGGAAGRQYTARMKRFLERLARRLRRNGYSAKLAKTSAGQLTLISSATAKTFRRLWADQDMSDCGTGY
jgi:hypothetical protein